MMTLEKVFKTIAQFNTELWPSRTVASVNAREGLMTQLLEEAGELSQATRNYFGRKYSPEKNTPADKKFIKDEIGDCFDILICVCQMFDIDPKECLQMSVEKLSRLKETYQEEQRLQYIMKNDVRQRSL